MLNTYSFLVCDKCDAHISHFHNIERIENGDDECPLCHIGKFKTIVEEIKPCPRCGDRASFADAISSKSVFCSCGINMVIHGWQRDEGRSLIYHWNNRGNDIGDGVSKKDMNTLLALCRIKYGNLDEDVDAELTRMEKLYSN